MTAWIKALFTPNKWNHQDVYVDYKQGSSYPYYTVSTHYSLGNRVIYNESVYECILPVGTTTNNPSTTPSEWRLYENFFIGVDERILFNHSKIVLEYALNKRFNTIFKQPPLLSDIYITNEPISNAPFIVGYTEEFSSSSYSFFSNEFVIDSYSLSFVYNYTIYVPLSVFNSLGTTNTLREKVIRTFVDRYNTLGLFYKIITY
jgi:hypothetical protein